ncbi:uncharacterized protein BXZ73DRAFT_80473 [Epithele typhae]|uniref:uncharacterized protein n=1 Tax=Epithele typhae TaxID=378194 RepID=UPI0020082251|nr:uncharacterized protein BXZ73DRAFT_80473 [Epithele typhae]KAH9918937.1 hypothetical protein BXZ73DRAFT_80473 [Epithele typhae]
MLNPWNIRNHIHVVDLVSEDIKPRLINHRSHYDAKAYASQAVLRCDSERGDFHVLALPEEGSTLMVDQCGEEASTAPLVFSPLHGLTPKALSADGTRTLCLVDAARPSADHPPAASPQFCVVDTATGDILSGPFEGELPPVVIGEHQVMSIGQFGNLQHSHGSSYRGGWFWSVTLYGRLYRTPAFDDEQDVREAPTAEQGKKEGKKEGKKKGKKKAASLIKESSSSVEESGRAVRVAVAYDGSMFVWSDWDGSVHFHRTVGGV